MRSTWTPGPEVDDLHAEPAWTRHFEPEDVADGWSFSPGADGARPSSHLEREAAIVGSGGLRFDRANGRVAFWVPATADATYDFAVMVRRAAAPVPLDPDAAAVLERDLLVGGVELYEVPFAPSAAADPALRDQQLLAAIAHKVALHRLACSGPAGGIERLALSFVSSLRTQGVVVILNAGAARWWRDPRLATAFAAPPGPVDFDEASLRMVPLRASVARAAGDGSPYVRKLALGGDLRRALLAPPDTEIRLPLILPSGHWRLRFGYGVADEARPGAGRVPIRFEARLETASATRVLPLPQAELAPAHDAAQWGWHDCRFENAAGAEAGGPATLVLTTKVALAGGSAASTLDLAAFAEPELIALSTPLPRAPGLLLVSIDTLRADRLGVLGYSGRDGRVASPHLDAFARECLLFTQARSTAPYTLPSHASMLTGLSPAAHGACRYESQLDPEHHPLLAVTLARAGFATAAFTSGGFLTQRFGFHFGFDRYTTLDPFVAAEDPSRDRWPRPADRAFNVAAAQRCDRPAIAAWIVDHADEPFFAFVHTYRVHDFRVSHERPLLPELPIEEADRGVEAGGRAGRSAPPVSRAELSDAYDAAITAADLEFGLLIDELRRRGLLQRMVIVVTSDHGEELGDHGGDGHGTTLYDEVLHVPLLIRVPGVPARRVDHAVSLVDLVPTLHAALGLPPPDAPGNDLLAALREDSWPESWSAHVDDPRLGTHRALTVGPWKLLEHLAAAKSEHAAPLPRFELFQIERDPFERHDLLRAMLDAAGGETAEGAAPPEFVGLRARLQATFAEFERERALRMGDAIPEIDERTRAELEALGYLDAGGSDG